ncbi:type VII secretion protein EccB [Streptomyces capillispiralis]|uniref:Type VII secretion protein EccB n=1 Tax=Streptomyces capillispiralis TaxID=68182 RepID=A0A561TBW0_9ACTN|nr:type VII secretion protein EccB [Streptomyces capillispiralis]TWF84592.1 type VII secretion protein EccB [Streptomyces capillispiralis]GHH92138.1 type VII secretion protein EccB [Streptomyces capillispiralis]
MQSKRDQVHAHSFMMGRLSSGLLMADPDAPESPLGRTTRGVVFGVLVTVLIGAGATVYGLLRPGGNDGWRDGEHLVVNRDTGARYVWTGTDGVLHPVRNYASARLIGGAELPTADVRTPSLKDVPVGTPVGIPGAPDAVPEPGSLDDGAWHMCVTGPEGALPDTSGAVSGTGVDKPGATTVVAGAPVDARGIGGDRGVLVSGPDDTEYLVWRGSRLPLDGDSDARNALGYGSERPMPVSAAFLDALAPGPALKSPEVPGRGEEGPEIGGEASRIGQLFKVSVPGGGSTYHLLREDGLVPLTRLGAALVLGDPATQEKAYQGSSPEVRTVGADALREHRAKDSGTAGSAELPDAPPVPQSTPRGTALCAQVDGGDGGARIRSVLVPLTGLAPVAVSEGTAQPLEEACVPTDATVVRPGHGALVRALNASGAAHAGTTYLVAENGVKYRVPGKDALQALGYGTADIGSVPAPLLATLPTGADLDPAAASGAAEPGVTAPECGTGDGEAEEREAAGKTDGADKEEAADAADTAGGASRG